VCCRLGSIKKQESLAQRRRGAKKTLLLFLTSQRLGAKDMVSRRDAEAPRRDRMISRRLRAGMIGPVKSPF